MLVFLTLGAVVVVAQFVSLSGDFTAHAVCPLLVSMRTGSNPGLIETEPGRQYKLLGKNNNPGRYYQVEVLDAPINKNRWVEMSCGSTNYDDVIDDDGLNRTAILPATRNTKNIIAMSWQPAFCETASTSQHPECEYVESGEFPAALKGFTLHGLWPQRTSIHTGAFEGSECDGARDGLSVCECGARTQLSLETPGDIDDELRGLMPAYSGSRGDLAEREWQKHGCCYGTSDDEYFADALFVLRTINNAMGPWLSANTGRQVTRQQFYNALNAAFGSTASAHTFLQCKRGGLLTEVRINLQGVINRNAPDARAHLTELIYYSPYAPQHDACGNSFEIDGIGSQ